jgi:uracil-DNA glycosylase family 4
LEEKMDFAQLHVHTTFSALDGLGLCSQYAEMAKDLGFKYLGITDHGVIDGLIKFQKACLKYDIRPILGSELYIVPDINEKNKSRGHICVWAKNQTGFENLTKILSYSNEFGFYYKPRVDFEYFLNHCEGLVVSTACLISFANVFKNDGVNFLGDLYDSIGQDLYAEVMPHNMEKQRAWNKKVIRLAKRFGIKIIATNDVHYPKRRDYKAQDVLLAIQRKTTMDDKDRFKFTVTDLYLKTDREMRRAFKKNNHPFEKSFLTNTIEICEKCSGYTIPKRDISLPRVPGVPINPNKAKVFLWNLCAKGFEEKFQKNIKHDREYHLRLKREYDLIIKKKFERYFLMVWELVNWCKQNDILIGPGRGSCGGSLMAYLLGITAVDPIKHNLIFDRFINEDRIDYPDIDIDFEDRKRHLIRQHLESIYGSDKIAGVSSFNRMKARAVVKDVGRAFGVHWTETDIFTKLIDDNSEDNNPIDTAIETYDECYKYANKNPEVIKFAKQLEGQNRGYGTHAAALIVSKEPINKSGRCSLRYQDGLPIVNWEKDDTEYVGLMKLDVLGLKLLSIFSETLSLIEKNFNRKIELEKLPLDDKKIFEDINDGKTAGAFQFNTYAMTALTKEMGVENFSHMVSAIALVRPGPLESGTTAEYIERKRGKKWKPLHEVYERITKDTYGLVIYQESVMRIISEMAGLPYSVADKIRKIIGKKRDIKEFEQYKNMFIHGCKKTGYFSPTEAKKFWSGLEKWSRYGFNMCTSGDTIVTITTNNIGIKTSKISLEELYYIWWKSRKQQRYIRILCLNGNEIKPGKIKNIFYNGKKIVFKIKTKSGKEIKATATHRFLTNNGYQEVHKLEKIINKLIVKNNGRIEQDEIVSIKYAGIEKTYDLEMNTREHNFFANDIVSHNSHSVEYSILGYWSLWLKHYYPVEFICASLSYGAENKKKEMIKEAYKLGLQIMLPKVGRSDAFRWKAIEGRLFIPFIEVKGIGDKKAIEAAAGQPKNSTAIGKKKDIRKFFTKEKEKEKASVSRIEGKFGELLNLIGAYEEGNPKITKEIRDLFKFGISADPKIEYKNLCGIFGGCLEENEINKAVSADKNLLKELSNNKILNRIKTPKTDWIKITNEISKCDKCQLIEQCKAPVAPSPGIFNVLILDEAPGPSEDKDRIGLVGRPGELIWKKLKPFPRRNFFVSSIVKCFPKTTKKPNIDQIETCSNSHLKKELETIKPIIILALGNCGLQFFKNQKSGITQFSGKAEWSEKYKAWIVYCINPAATLHNKDNKVFFDAGIKKFKEIIRALGMKGSKRY